MSEFLTYLKFHTKEEAEEFAALLESHNIIFDAERSRAILDPVYIGTDSEPDYIVKIRQEDFPRVNELMKREAEKQVENVRPDYYLFQFSNEELADVLRKPDEWNYFDQLLAKKILTERNISPDSIAVEPAENNDQATKPSRIQPFWLFMSFLGSVIFPFAGFPIGLALIFSQRTLKDGSKVHLFDTWTRNYGWILLVLGLLRIVKLYFFPQAGFPG